MNDEANRKILCDISQCAFKVVARLLDRDQLLARELRSLETTSRQVFREECITVEMATNLREQFSQHVEITLFTPLEETRTGADWYWRFEKGDRAIHALVQAKRVQRVRFEQLDRDGYVNIDLDQLRVLMQSTSVSAKELPGLEAWVATYARFDAIPPCGQDQMQNCYRHHHDEPCLGNVPCLWIGQAWEIAKLQKTRLDIQSVVQESVRLDCILPCIEDAGSSNGPGRKGFVLRSDLPTYDACINAILTNVAMPRQLEGAMLIHV